MLAWQSAHVLSCRPAAPAAAQLPQPRLLHRSLRIPGILCPCAASPADNSVVAPGVPSTCATGKPGLVCFSKSAGIGVSSFSGPGVTGPAGTSSSATSSSSSVSRVQQLRDRLQRYGLAGLLAYGLLNTLYYSCMFMFVWLHVAKVPQGLGIQGAARKFVEVFALTWGGSQLTKVARAAGALALAPAVDTLLDGVQSALKFKTKRQAFGVVVGFCVALALALFLGVVGTYA